MTLGCIFDYDQKKLRHSAIEQQLSLPETWQNQELSLSLAKEKASLFDIFNRIDILTASLVEFEELYSMAIEEDDHAEINSISKELLLLQKKLDELEFQRMFDNKHDASSAYLEIQSGSGGTEAQDWAEMLQRMYLRWADSHKFTVELIDTSPGEVAGIKSCTIKVSGSYAYGWLRTETGVHRLVRRSPFDSSNRRHTSFAAVFITPEIDDDVAIDINPADLRIDTYRASGAGGQHVNTTDSAIRITHIPSSLVVQCQSDRSQHKNKAQAMKQIRAKLYQHEMDKRNSDKKMLESEKSAISWGNQIRSYVLDDARIKDLRTGVESSNTQAVLDGNIDSFIEACLKQNKKD